jgi:sulfur relay (sulfurtransferase) complex TusBCD TusD component (DsrE family)
MKIAYIFANNMASTYKLGKMILPQIEAGIHGATVVGMFFFDDNTYLLRQGNPVGERLAAVAKEHGILLMACDRCATERGLADGPLELCGTGQVTPKDLVEGVGVGCFPQLYDALGGNPPDQIITL